MAIFFLSCYLCTWFYFLITHYLSAMKKQTIFFFLLQFSLTALAQDMRYIKQTMTALSAPGMGGRGYIGPGRDKAARFILKQFTDLGLSSFYEDDRAFQFYYFPVNTFPADPVLKWGRKELLPAVDFLVDAGSTAFRSMGKEKLERVDLYKIKTEDEWDKVKARFNSLDIYQLRGADTLCRRLGIRMHQLVDRLPKACYIIPQSSKLTWTVATDTLNATVLYVADTAVPRGRKVTVSVQNKFQTKVQNKNVLAFIPGTEVKDSFLVFTAHYDHLGKLGRKAIFYGANDNATGTAFILAMARYFKANPQRYSIAFMAFSGEEAGLLGSKYYVQNPAFPLDKIKMLINIDLMGDATDGITVVNAVKEQNAYNLLSRINGQKNYLPKIASRDNAPNSDHYPFTQAGVPAIFIYANGGKGHYHDIWDRAKEISFRRIEKVGQLVIDFTKALCAP